MARGGSGSRSRRVTTYRVTARRSAPPPNRNRLLVAVGGVIVVGALGAVLVLSGTLQGLLGQLGAAIPGSGTPAPSRPATLPAGTYQSRAFQPQLTFTLPAGWWVAADSADFLQLAPVDSDQLGIYLFRDPSAASQATACPLSPEPGVGGLSTDLSTWIRGRPGFVTSNPRLAQVGGLRGVELDVGIVDSWTASCPFANGAPTVPLFVDEPARLRWVVAGSERLRLSLLDVPGGGTVVVDIDAFDGSLWDDFVNRATPIVQGFRFASPGGSPSATP
ncbi:MAG TPA: hypothetical protein VJ506_09650 [Candidatus Limnocylindrales bacterium]|nr:hypothetical protein [Candidatus Limnocylindrales bacterium]